MLHRKTVTIGEVVAHVIPFNSVSSLETAFCTLFDADIKTLIADARDPHLLRRDRESVANLLVASVDDLWRDLALALDRRHMLTDEAATKLERSFNDAKAAVDSCASCTNALDAVVWSTIWKDLPLTEYGMNVEA
ncbi:hypothetical protein C3L29_041025, partial [Pseudomonas sp. MWU12-2534b]